MRLTCPRHLLSVLISLTYSAILHAQTVGTAFTYQGELINNGVPVESACDFEFTLHDAVTGGNQIGGPLSENGVPLSNGVFTVVLDFDADVFDGNARWLGITVTCQAISAVPIPLSPRQELRPVPYALALPAMRIEQSGPDPVPNDCFTASFFVAPNVIGGWHGNAVEDGVQGATIAGGGGVACSFFLAEQPNRATSSFATVGGGRSNTANGMDASVGGGFSNTASGSGATVPGGRSNVAGGDFSFAAGQRAKVRNESMSGVAGGDKGTFVWADSTNEDFQSTGSDQFLIRASGGVGIGTANPETDLHVSGGIGSVTLFLEADTNDSGPGNRPSLLMSRRGGGVQGALGFVGDDLSLGVGSFVGGHNILLQTQDNVGIGTDDPNTKLHVADHEVPIVIGNFNHDPEDHTALIENSFEGALPPGETFSDGTANVLALQVHHTDTTPAITTKFVTFYNKDDEVLGAFHGDDNGGVTLTSGGADYAEWLPRLNEDEGLKPGDIVGVRGGRIGKDTRDAERTMVVSTAPIVLGNAPPSRSNRSEYEKISFLGQAPIRVRGSVRAGDYIVPSGDSDGVGRAVPADSVSLDQLVKVVGRAWENSDEPGVKKVNCVIGAGVMSEVTAPLVAVIQAQQQRIAELEDRVARIEALIKVADQDQGDGQAPRPTSDSRDRRAAAAR